MTIPKVLVLYFCACFLGNQNGVTMTAASDDPYSDPVNDIPKSFVYADDELNMEKFLERQPDVLREKEELRRHQAELDKIGDKDPLLRDEIDLAFRRKNRPVFDFEAILDRNIQEQNMMPPLRPATAPPPKDFNPFDETADEKIAEFGPGHFNLNDEFVTRPKKKNWTTCEQFRKDAPLFVPDDIIAIDWIPFFQWASVDEGYESSPLTTFTHTTQKVVQMYYNKYGRIKSNYTVNWNKPSLLMKQPQNGLEMLLIQGGKNGFFYAIRNIVSFTDDNVMDVAFRISIDSMQFKIFENYLAVMYCEATMALLMARAGFEPPTRKDKREIAKRLKFRGRGRVLVRDVEKEQEIMSIYEEQRKEEKLIKDNTRPKNPTDNFPEPHENPTDSGNKYYNRFSGGGNKMSRGGWERFD